MGLTKGSIVLVQLDPTRGSEQGKTRPAIIIQHTALVNSANTVIIVPISSAIPATDYAFQVKFKANQLNLQKDGVIKVEHIRSIDKIRITKIIGQAPAEIMNKIFLALLHVTDNY
jgi:mRNA interferase MazF